MIIRLTGREPGIHDAVRHATPCWRPLYRALAEQKIDCVKVTQGSGPFHVPSGRPAFLYLGDDMHMALGPAAFHDGSVRSFMRRCSAFVVVSAGSNVEPYRFAAETAGLQRRNVILVETRPSQETAWIELLRSINPTAFAMICTVRPEPTQH